MQSPGEPPAWLLGLEGGGTKTLVRAESIDGSSAVDMRLGPGNLRLLSDRQLRHLLRQAASAAPHPAAIGIGMAGARTPADQRRVEAAAARVWPGIPCRVTHDLDLALRAATPPRPSRGRKPSAQVLVLCGTGSCCYARNERGETLKLGGWGHLLGDKGSGYDIGLRSLKAAVYYLDRDRRWSRLGQGLLRHLQLNEPEALIDWISQAGKEEIAALAPVTFEAAKARDPIARDVMEGAAQALARDARTLASRLARAREPVRFVLAGGVFEGQPAFARKVGRLLRAAIPEASVGRLRKPAVHGAIELARQAWALPRQRPTSPPRHRPPSWFVPTLEQVGQSPTERRHTRSMNLDRMKLADAIELFLQEDRHVIRALRHEQAILARIIRRVVRTFRQGGRLFYVGAGTSGRLGVLDASECPPTFQTPPEQVQAIIAGGAPALQRAVEGAEDDPEAGATAMGFRGVGHPDFVVGIAASGRTPFVWGALHAARRAGAATGLLTFNPDLQVPPQHRPDILLAPNIGAELLTGSTRLKAGTATKLILNLITTLSMVRTGKVLGNLMIDVHPSNAKLRARAVRIVQTLAGTDAETSRQALQQWHWNIRKAVKALT